jgi:hypothetical protein
MAFAWIGFYDLEDEEYEAAITERLEKLQLTDNDN